MIRSISVAELTRLQKNFYYKNHNHVGENVFVYVVGQEVNRAYELCKLCGQMKPLVIEGDLALEIKAVVDKKVIE